MRRNRKHQPDSSRAPESQGGQPADGADEVEDQVETQQETSKGLEQAVSDAPLHRDF